MPATLLPRDEGRVMAPSSQRGSTGLGKDFRRRPDTQQTTTLVFSFTHIRTQKQKTNRCAFLFFFLVGIFSAFLSLCLFGRPRRYTPSHDAPPFAMECYGRVFLGSSVLVKTKNSFFRPAFTKEKSSDCQPPCYRFSGVLTALLPRDEAGFLT